MHSLLITGPAASGKSTVALRTFLETPNAILLTPTSTMAEHVRNELARASVAVRPNRILTLEKFLEPFTALRKAPESLLHLLIAQKTPDQFPGFHRALVSLIQEAPQHVHIASEIEEQLATRGHGLRSTRLRTAEPTAEHAIIFDGFFTFAPAELELIERLAEQTPLTVTLPDWSGSCYARERLLAAGFVEQRMEKTLRQARRHVRAAPSIDLEVEQIAVSILESGREFREIGILLRSRDPYAQALESTLARFGIPARFHFAEPLADHPAIQYIAGIVRTALNGWDHESLLTWLRMPFSGLTDGQDFNTRESLPASGASFSFQANFSSPMFTEINLWTHARQPAAAWAQQLKTLRRLIPAPEITDGVDHTQLQIWRSQAAALQAFGESLDTTALALHASKISLAEFWPHFETALKIEKLRVPDRRRNVVNVLDIYEARQWELPMAFVCGLNERIFPQYHRENPLLNDAARKQAGLPTSDDRQQEEQFLFEIACTRATDELVLSYARFNEKGDAALRSFFLKEEGAPIGEARVLPKPKEIPLPRLDEQAPRPHTHLSASSIESFLQCPFQFFARKTLRLRNRPLKPRDRLDALLQGTILHQAIAEDGLDPVFERECARHNIPETYRREAVRLELLRHFEAFQGDRQWPLKWRGASEKKFEIALTPELTIRGRIDRLLSGPKKQAIVIDYKYSTVATLRGRINADPVQGGLYLVAAEKQFQQKPVGMFYCGLRQSVSWEGWHTNVSGLALGESITETGLRELMDAAQQKAIETFVQIQAGERAVRPADPNKCRYCDYNDICRIESQTHVALDASA